MILQYISAPMQCVLYCRNVLFNTILYNDSSYEQLHKVALVKLPVEATVAKMVKNGLRMNVSICNSHKNLSCNGADFY